MKAAKTKTPAELNLHIDHRNCRLQLSTPKGPARLAVIDCDGNILPVANVEKLMVDAACDAMLDFIEPSFGECMMDMPNPMSN